MLEQAIKRLTNEIFAHRQYWRSEGYKRGQEDAEQLPYSQLMGYGSGVVFYGDDTRDWEYLPDIAKEDVEVDACNLDPESPGFGLDKDAFAEGWFRAISEAWKELTVKLKLY